MEKLIAVITDHKVVITYTMDLKPSIYGLYNCD